jgi:HxlR-like helix-turn-helix
VVTYDVFLADCPARTTLDLVADTWSVIAVVALERGPARYSELQQRIGGISKKMLTQTLRKLEANGLVERRVLRTAPAGRVCDVRDEETVRGWPGGSPIATAGWTSWIPTPPPRSVPAFLTPNRWTT